MAKTQSSFAMWQAMESSDSLLVYADWQEEFGNYVTAAEVRSIAWRLRQAELLVPDFNITPTGSRYYGELYYKDSSDWDWLVHYETPGGSTDHSNNLLYKTLKQYGWEGWDYAMDGHFAMFCGKVNLIVRTTDGGYETWKAATEECYEVKPSTRKEALDIFAKHRAIGEDVHPELNPV